MRLKSVIATALALAALTGAARAEVKKYMLNCGNALCPFYELQLTPPQGFALDKEATHESKVQLLIPRGKTFGNAPAIIYVKVSPREQEQAFADFIRVSQERWRQSVKDTRITPLGEIARANGKAAYQAYRYENPSRPQQAYEIVAFAEDTDSDGNRFAIMVVLTTPAKKALAANEEAYRAFLRAH